VWEERRHALRTCAEQLPARERRVLQMRYDQAVPVEDVAASLSMSRGAVDTMLYRIRKALLSCVEGRLHRLEMP
jgi:RNA polymerase sigma factor (sigma-70 family)